MASRATIDFLPIFRTNAQWLLLTHLYVLTRHGELVTTAELARTYQIPPATLNDEVRRLVASELLIEHRAGRARFLQANYDHPGAISLAQLLALTSGPLCSLRELYTNPAVREVLIFGSYARRYLSENGPFPRDVDVLVVVEGNSDVVDPSVELDVQASAIAIGSELDKHVEINAWVVTEHDWNAPEAGSVLGQLKNKSEPIVDVPAW